MVKSDFLLQYVSHFLFASLIIRFLGTYYHAIKQNAQPNKIRLGILNRRTFSILFMGC